jgi:hypothetical protein
MGIIIPFNLNLPSVLEQIQEHLNPKPTKESMLHETKEDNFLCVVIVKNMNLCNEV